MSQSAPGSRIGPTGAQIFDWHSGDYRDILSHSVKLSGEGHEFFVRDKVERIRAVFRERPGSHVLEVGCGVGLLTEGLGRAFPSCSVTGMDISTKSLEVASGQCGGLKNVAFRLFDGVSFPREVERADLIVLANVLHHIEPSLRQSFMERVVLAGLRPNGKVVLFEHNPFNPLTQYVVKNCPLDRGARLLSLRVALALLRRMRMRVIKRDYIIFFPRPLSFLRGLEFRLRRVPLGAQYVVVGGVGAGGFEDTQASPENGI